MIIWYQETFHPHTMQWLHYQHSYHSILVCDNRKHKGCKQDLFLLVLFRNLDLYSAYADDVSEVHSASIFSVKVISESQW
jgi:hypothetical protein